MPLGTTDFCHFISVTLIFAEGHKVSAKQPVCFIFVHTVQLIRMKFDALFVFKAEYSDTL